MSDKKIIMARVYDVFAVSFVNLRMVIDLELSDPMDHTNDIILI